MLLHATTVAIASKAILITGPSGAGKSDLGLRLIDAGAKLVADDQTIVTRHHDALHAAAPENIRGLIEVRGIGLLRLPYVSQIMVALCVELIPGAAERMPEPVFSEWEGAKVRTLHLNGFDASTPAKIRAYLQYPKVTDTP